MARTDSDYAIEFGEYLATAADHFMAVQNKFNALALDGDDTQADRDEHSDAWRGLQSAIYDFRKRAARAEHESAPKLFNK